MNIDWGFLERNLGSRLTSELAHGMQAAITQLVHVAYQEAFADAVANVTSFEGRLDVQAEPEAALDGYTFRVGSYEQELPLFSDLQTLHMQELETARDPNLVKNVSHTELIRRERNKQLTMFMLDHVGFIVGYMIVQPFRDHATQKIFAGELHFFVTKEHRRGWLAIKFIRYIERALKAAGAYEFRVGSRNIKDVTPIYRRLGYNEIARVSSKVL